MTYSSKPRKIVITEALLYANGDVHLGHVLGCIQSDIWARFQRLRGHECHYVSGSDTHGTPIMIKAQSLNLDPLEMVINVAKRQQEDFAGFDISFDSFEITHDPLNQALVNKVYEKLKEKGDIVVEEVEQAYDNVKSMFLPDRYIKGTCPRCNKPDQYGDSCEACGATYGPMELIDPVSVLSGVKPGVRTSTHYFLKTSNYTELLKTWYKTCQIQPEVINKLSEWFETGLRSWDISRDAPYFGFEIPDAPNKFFYVWLDAPVGYISSSKSSADKLGVDYNSFWEKNSDYELVQFMGKDIAYFHLLFWPVLLMGGGYRLPNRIQIHGFLTVDSCKMSKSRGTFIRARDYLNAGLNTDCLRYYFAAKLNSSVKDIDLNLQDMLHKVNSDLVGKIANIASRCSTFVKKFHNNILADELDESALWELFVSKSGEIADLYERCEYSYAMQEIMKLTDLANQYIDRCKPWILAKQPDQMRKVHLVCTQGINLFHICMIYLSPVIPKAANSAKEFLNTESLCWKNVEVPLLGRQINDFKPILSRLNNEQLDILLNRANCVSEELS
ncbi:MAG: methionine--tRNA ligase [Gammaproteobacteria bacterium]|nr:methionine--tRNA ligase [Gammaproteobacteria bacterium]